MWYPAAGLCDAPSTTVHALVLPEDGAGSPTPEKRIEHGLGRRYAFFTPYLAATTFGPEAPAGTTPESRLAVLSFCATSERDGRAGNLGMLTWS